MTEYQMHEAVTRQLCEELSQLQAINAELVASIQKPVQEDTSQIMSDEIKPNNSLVQAARQPLTDEQVWKSEEIMAVNAAVGLVMDDLMMLVRAVERIHGIGGEA